MATGDARRLARHDPRPVAVLDKRGLPRWHPCWEGNPKIVSPQRAAKADHQTIVNGSGARPYIDYERSTKERWVYTDYRVTPGELWWCDARPDHGYVIVEPHIKPNASPNKDWGWERWQALIDLLPHLPWAQMGPPGTRVLRGVRHIETHSFQHACEWLSGAPLAVLPEGGLHHAAAALGVKAVVLFGAMPSPRCTAYDSQVNFIVDDPEALGWRVPHPACARAWERITPEMVATAVKERIWASKPS